MTRVVLVRLAWMLPILLGVSVVAFVYMLIFGSLIAFSAYNWLMRNVDPTMVATHTFVNPVVAVFLGWWIADEQITDRTLIAAALIILSVVLTTLADQKRRRDLKRRAAVSPVLAEASAS